MADTDPAPPNDSRASERRRDVNWPMRIGLIAGLAVVGVVALIMAAAFLPRWWAHRIGDQVDQSTVQGVTVGLFYGVLCTFVPLMVLWLAFHKRRRWQVWAALTGLALLLAAPNLLTLGIVVGNSDAAHAGERILDTEANYFRASTLIGAILAVILFAFVISVFMKRWRTKRAEARIKAEREALERDRAAPPAP